MACLWQWEDRAIQTLSDYLGTRVLALARVGDGILFAVVVPAVGRCCRYALDHVHAHSGDDWPVILVTAGTVACSDDPAAAERWNETAVSLGDGRRAYQLRFTERHIPRKAIARPWTYCLTVTLPTGQRVAMRIPVTPRRQKPTTTPIAHLPPLYAMLATLVPPNTVMLKDAHTVCTYDGLLPMLATSTEWAGCDVEALPRRSMLSIVLSDKT